MIWLSWRQFRGQAVAGVVVLALLTAYLVALGLGVRDSYHDYLAQCPGSGDCAGPMGQFSLGYENTLLYLDGLLGLVPGLLGMFWGAPLISRELEAGTQRLAWNQSVTRRRWLLFKLLVVGLAGTVVAGTASLLLTWAAAPVDQVAGNRFSTVVFGARFLPPVAYAAFAFVLGTLIGLLVRRTVPAMALTLVAFVVVQFLVPNLIRPHLMPPEHLAEPMTVSAINGARSLGSITGAPVLHGITIPQGWVTDVSDLMTARGRPLDEKTFNECYLNAPKTGATEGPYGDIAVCLARLNLHLDITYQPWNRYWAFQFLESGFYLMLTALLIGAAQWRIRRGPTS